MLSAMMRVAPSSVMTVPLGKARSAAASELVPSGSTRTRDVEPIADGWTVPS